MKKRTGEREALWKSGEVAVFLGLTRRSVNRMAAARELPAVVLRESQRTLRRFDPDAVRRWLAERGGVV